MDQQDLEDVRRLLAHETDRAQESMPPFATLLTAATTRRRRRRVAAVGASTAAAMLVAGGIAVSLPLAGGTGPMPPSPAQPAGPSALAFPSVRAMTATTPDFRGTLQVTPAGCPVVSPVPGSRLPAGGPFGLVETGPGRWTLEEVDGRWVVKDPSGEEVVAEGDRVVLAGGVDPGSPVEDADACGGLLDRDDRFLVLVQRDESPRLETPTAASTSRWTPTFKKNAKGETYGSGAYAMSPEEEPDLMSAVATNGKSGYIRTSELEAAAPPPANPEEAAKNEGPLRDSIPVYESDGTTIIGEFRIGGGGSETATHTFTRPDGSTVIEETVTETVTPQPQP